MAKNNKKKEVKKVKGDVKMEKATVYTEIFKSTDYEMVKYINTNRAINSTNYNKLIRSMKEEQLIIPICLNEKFEIIDGQHRFLACKELGLPYYYYVQEGYKEEQMKRANLVGLTWNKKDFLNMYVNYGEDTYIEIKELMDKYSILVSDMIRVIAATKKMNYKEIGLTFEEGNLSLTESDFLEIILFLESLSLFKSFKAYNKSKFISAFLELYSHELYDHKLMVEKFKKRGAILTEQLTKDNYLALLANKIYSFGSNKSNIYYDPDRKTLYVPR